VNYHLVILKKAYLDLILDGTKSVELRLTKTRCAPSGQISIGDKLFLKISSGPVCARATVNRIKEFTNLTKEKMNKLKKQYNHLICGRDDYWQKKGECSFGVLVWLKDVRPIEPVEINKKDWRAWVILTKALNYGLLKKPNKS